MNKDMIMELIKLNEMLFDNESEYADPMEYLYAWQRFDILMKEINECVEVKEVLQLVCEIMELQEQMSDCFDPNEYIELWGKLEDLVNELKEVI